MTNPFPGVDPYIEPSEYWVGFHNVFVSQISKLLNNALLSRGFVAVVDERDDPGDPPWTGKTIPTAIGPSTA